MGPLILLFQATLSLAATSACLLNPRCFLSLFTVLRHVSHGRRLLRLPSCAHVSALKSQFTQNSTAALAETNSISFCYRCINDCFRHIMRQSFFLTLSVIICFLSSVKAHNNPCSCECGGTGAAYWRVLSVQIRHCFRAYETKLCATPTGAKAEDVG